MTTQERLMTVDEFEAFCALPENRDRLWELIDGEVVEKVPTQTHSWIAGILYVRLVLFLTLNPIGRAYFEVRYKLPKDNHNAFQPDLSYVADMSRPIGGRGAALYMPELCVEVQSPDDSIREMRDKATYYLTNGAHLVWLVYPAKRALSVLTPTDEQLLLEADTLDGGDVLPGFTIKVADIFAGLE